MKPLQLRENEEGSGTKFLLYSWEVVVSLDIETLLLHIKNLMIFYIDRNKYLITLISTHRDFEPVWKKK